MKRFKVLNIQTLKLNIRYEIKSPQLDYHLVPCLGMFDTPVLDENGFGPLFAFKFALDFGFKRRKENHVKGSRLFIMS